MYLRPAGRAPQGAYLRGITMDNKHPLFTVEELDEWKMEVFEDYVISIDCYEGFAEIMFNIEI